MSVITREQREAIYRKYQQSPDGTASYREFRKRVIGPIYASDPCLMLSWCGMWLGIEVDGYTHS